jgi:rhodanese-related sulfurtransferase
MTAERNSFHRWSGLPTIGSDTNAIWGMSDELAQYAIPGAVHNPMSSFDFDAVPSDINRKLIFVCAHGARSKQVGQYLLQENRITAAYNLTGGVVA